MSEDWKEQAFRQKVIHQLEELIGEIPPSQVNNNAQDLELQVFQRSERREDYMTSISRVIVQLRRMAQRRTQ